jgi:hypothetical protein
MVVVVQILLFGYFICVSHSVGARIPPFILWLGYGLNDWGNVATVLSGQGIFLFSLCSDLFWGPPSPLFNGYWDKAAMAWIYSWPASSPWVKNSGVVRPLLRVNGVHKDVFTLPFIRFSGWLYVFQNVVIVNSCIFIGLFKQMYFYVFFVCLRGNRSCRDTVW